MEARRGAGEELTAGAVRPAVRRVAAVWEAARPPAVPDAESGAEPRAVPVAEPAAAPPPEARAAGERPAEKRGVRVGAAAARSESAR